MTSTILYKYPQKVFRRCKRFSQRKGRGSIWRGGLKSNHGSNRSNTWQKIDGCQKNSILVYFQRLSSTWILMD